MVKRTINLLKVVLKIFFLILLLFFSKGSFSMDTLYIKFLKKQIFMNESESSVYFSIKKSNYLLEKNRDTTFSLKVLKSRKWLELGDLILSKFDHSGNVLLRSGYWYLGKNYIKRKYFIDDSIFTENLKGIKVDKNFSAIEPDIIK